MKPFNLFLGIVSQTLIIASSQAPGDQDRFCTTLSESIYPPVYPSNTKILMDSYNYIQLIPTPDPQDGVWQQVDVDLLRNTTNNNPADKWNQPSSLACQQIMSSCYFSSPHTQNNWLITQHISRQVNGSLLPQVSVLVEFELEGCSSGCQKSFLVNVWETSNINRDEARNVSQYRRVKRVPPLTDSGLMSQNASIQVNFKTNKTGFYLAFVDDDTCIVITRVIVFYYVCPAVTNDLVMYPETLSPPIQDVPQLTRVTGQCVEGAEGELSGNNPSLQCIQVGKWDIIQEGTGCRCREGFLAINSSQECTICPDGKYVSLANSFCQPFPANTRNDGVNVAICPCLDDYYRLPNKTGDFPCTYKCLSEYFFIGIEETTNILEQSQKSHDSTSTVVYAVLSIIILLLFITLVSISSCFIFTTIHYRRRLNNYKIDNDEPNLKITSTVESEKNPSYGVNMKVMNRSYEVETELDFLNIS